MFSVVMVLLALFDILFWRWADARLKHMPRPRFWRGLSAILVLAQLAGLGLMILPSDAKAILPPAFWRPFSTWLYVWHLLVIPVTLVLLLPVGLWIGLRRLVSGRQRSAPVSVVATEADGSGEWAGVPLMTSRRRFLGATAALAPQLGLAAGLLESDRQAGKFRIRELTLSIPGLPKRLEGMVIAHVSDTHVGRFVREHELEHVVQATADLKPDLVAFTGDLIDYNIADLDMSVAALKQMERMIKAPLAVCVGNHDLFDKPNIFRQRMRTEEVGLIVDEVMPVEIRGEKFNLLGLDWGVPGQERSDGVGEHMNRLIDKHWSGGFGILLAHHPHAFDQAAAAGIPLTLSGHTHGGQIMLTDKIGLGPLAYRYWSGVYEKGNQRLVVSNGVGNWFPIRIGAPAEIAKITLRGA